MVTLCIFLILSIAEFVLFYCKIEQMKEAGKIGHAIGTAAGLDTKYQPFLDQVAHFILKLKWLMWIFVPAILCVNLVAAWILSYFIDLITLILSWV